MSLKQILELTDISIREASGAVGIPPTTFFRKYVDGMEIMPETYANDLSMYIKNKTGVEVRPDRIMQSTYTPRVPEFTFPSFQGVEYIELVEVMPGDMRPTLSELATMAGETLAELGANAGIESPNRMRRRDHNLTPEELERIIAHVESKFPITIGVFDIASRYIAVKDLQPQSEPQSEPRNDT